MYQNFLVAAVKLHCYVAATRRDERDPRALRRARVRALAEGIGYMERATERAALAAFSANEPKGRRTVRDERIRMKGRKAKGRRRAVAKTHVRFLGLSAFLATFSRKKTRHAGTVHALRAALAAPEMRKIARGLKPVLEDPAERRVRGDTVLSSLTV